MLLKAFIVEAVTTPVGGSTQIKILIKGVVNATMNDHEYQHATERSELVRMLLREQTGLTTFAQLRPSVIQKTVVTCFPQL